MIDVAAGSMQGSEKIVSEIKSIGPVDVSSLLNIQPTRES